jgi:hypothetical protein
MHSPVSEIFREPANAVPNVLDRALPRVCADFRLEEFLVQVANGSGAAVGSVVPFPESYCLDEGNTTLRFIQGFGGVAYL